MTAKNSKSVTHVVLNLITHYTLTFVARWHGLVGPYEVSHVIFETVKPSPTWHTSQIFRSHICETYAGVLRTEWHQNSTLIMWPWDLGEGTL